MTGTQQDAFTPSATTGTNVPEIDLLTVALGYMLLGFANLIFQGMLTLHTLVRQSCYWWVISIYKMKYNDDDASAYIFCPEDGRRGRVSVLAAQRGE
jgi:hypothetical protein